MTFTEDDICKDANCKLMGRHVHTEAKDPYTGAKDPYTGEDFDEIVGTSVVNGTPGTDEYVILDRWRSGRVTWRAYER